MGCEKAHASSEKRTPHQKCARGITVPTSTANTAPQLRTRHQESSHGGARVIRIEPKQVVCCVENLFFDFCLFFSAPTHTHSHTLAHASIHNHTRAHTQHKYYYYCYYYYYMNTVTILSTLSFSLPNRSSMAFRQQFDSNSTANLVNAMS